jgi:hypothetical protein
MEQASAPPPPPRRPGPPPVPPEGEAELATREELRGLRRWIVVAIVWAVAASAIALIALLEEEPTGDGTREEDVARDLSRLARTLDRRIDSLESQVEDLPRSEDLSNLEARVRRAEVRASRATSDEGEAARELRDLEDRVRKLEEAASRRGDTTTPGQTDQSSP